LTAFTRRSDRSSSVVSEVNVGASHGQGAAYAAEEGRNSLEVADYYLNDKKDILRSGNGVPPTPNWFLKRQQQEAAQQEAARQKLGSLDEQALREQEKQRNARLRRNITSWLGRQRQQKMVDPAAARVSHVSSAAASHLSSGGGQHQIRSHAVERDGLYNISRWSLPMRPPPAPTDDKFDVPSVVNGGDDDDDDDDHVPPAPDRTKSLDTSAMRGVAVPRSEAGSAVSAPPMPTARPFSAEELVVGRPGTGPADGNDKSESGGGAAPTVVTTAKAVAITPVEPDTMEAASPRDSLAQSAKP
jgi:hypothetical protein